MSKRRPGDIFRTFSGHLAGARPGPQTFPRTFLGHLAGLRPGAPPGHFFDILGTFPWSLGSSGSQLLRRYLLLLVSQLPISHYQAIF